MKKVMMSTNQLAAMLTNIPDQILIHKLIESINKDGYLVIDDDWIQIAKNQVVDGACRVLAAQALNISFLPVMVAEEESDLDKFKFFFAQFGIALGAVSGEPNTWTLDGPMVDRHMADCYIEFTVQGELKAVRIEY